MRDSSFYITYGQVAKISFENRAVNLDYFSDNVVRQEVLNRILREREDFDETLQTPSSIVQTINMLDESSNLDEIQKEYNSLNEKREKPRKIITIPTLEVFLQEYGNALITCMPLVSNLTEIPKIGSWVPVLVIHDNNILNTKSNTDKSFFYFPFSLFKRSGDSLVNTTTIGQKNKTNKANSKEILWPRSGSTMIQNKNGKSNIISDGDSILLSTGFQDLSQKLNNEELDEIKLFEYQRFNPISQKDSLIFLDKYDLDWEDQLNEYRKQIFELGQFSIDDPDKVEIIEKIITKLSEVTSFKDRMKLFFGIDFSDKYIDEYPKDTTEAEKEVLRKDNGVLICGTNIYLSGNINKKSKQKDYTVTRSEPLKDILRGLIDALIDLTKEVIDHQHAGSPAKVLQTIPGGAPPGTIATDIEERLKTIKGMLERISSSQIHIS